MESSTYKNMLTDRINNNHPENMKPLYNIITHSKIDFVNYGLVKTKYMAWCDFGYYKLDRFYGLKI